MSWWESLIEWVDPNAGLPPKCVVVAARCERSRDWFGIQFEHVDEGRWEAIDVVDASSISKLVHRRTTSTRGNHVMQGIALGDSYPGCPHCGARQFVHCGCGAITCFKQRAKQSRCTGCGTVASVSEATDTKELTGYAMPTPTTGLGSVSHTLDQRSLEAFGTEASLDPVSMEGVLIDPHESVELRMTDTAAGKEGEVVEVRQIHEINQKMIDCGAALDEHRFLFRLTYIWLFGGNSVVAGLLILQALLLEGQSLSILLDAVGGVVIVVSTAFATTSLLKRRRTIRNDQHIMAKLRETKRYLLSLGSAELEAVRKNYRDDVAITIEQYRVEAKRWRRIHNLFQSIIIAGSITTTSVTAAIGVEPWLKWLAAALSLTVGISASFTGYYKFRERGHGLQQTADDIEAEYNAVSLGIRKYRGREAQEALEIFAEQVEALKDEQRKREQQLEQPPEHRQQQTQA